MRAKRSPLPYGQGAEEDRKGAKVSAVVYDRSMKARVFVSPKTTVLDPQGQTIRGALLGLGHASIADVRRGIAASIACRAAIKINTPLDQRKMEWMLRTLAATDYPMACPHGRPVALQYSTRDILKAFHRI